jgi:hypothetical protein
MAEIHINTNSSVSTKIIYGGEIVNADGDLVTATVYDITEDPALETPVNPDNPIFSSQAIKIETDNGSYKINIPYHQTSRLKNLKIRWSYAISGTSQQHFSNVDIIQPYCSLSEAIEDLNLGTDPSDPNYKTYHELVMAEKYARRMIDDFTGQKFSLYDDVHVIYGSGYDVLPLSYKLNTLYKLYVNDILLIDSTQEINNWGRSVRISETGFGLRVNRADEIDNSVYSANGMVPPSINDIGSGSFIKDYTYRVEGRFGWSEVPDEVEQACIELMGHFFDKDRVWKDQYMKSISTFDWKFEYASSINSGTGCAYADKLLSPYVLNQMVVI